MSGLALVAGGGLAREVIAQERLLDRFDELLVLDDAPSRWGQHVGGVRVVGGVESIVDHPDHQVLVCCGKGSTRAAVVARLAAAGVTTDRFATSLHPTATVSPGCRVGPGSIVLAGTVLTADVVVGAHVVCMPQVVLTHDDVVADHVTLCAGVTLGGSVVVETEAYLGMRASVREGVRVGAGAVLGMGSVLLRDLPAGETWAGVPAVRITTAAGVPADHQPADGSPAAISRGPVAGRRAGPREERA